MQGKKALFGIWVLAVFILLCLRPQPALSAAGSGDEVEKWVWTEKNPKPVWWTWGEDYEKSKPVRGGYYRSASQRYIGLMNPNHWPVNDWVAMTQLYEMLIYNDGSYRASIPWLAKSWEFVDPQTVVMKLRRGVKFHDGTSFNAHTLKYQIDWIKDKANGAWTSAWVAPVKSVEVLDDYTVKWRFTKPWAAFPGIMANVPGYCISKKALEGDVILREAKTLANQVKKAKKKADKAEKKAQDAAAKGSADAQKLAARAKKAREKAIALEKKAKEMAEKAKGIESLDVHPVGSGRHMLEEGRPGNYLKLKRNPNWWFGKSIGRPDMPYFDGWMIYVIPDASVRLANLRAGKIDNMSVDKFQYASIKNDPNLKVYVVNQNHVAALRFNTVKGPCKDIRVRKAISHAIDREALVKGVQFGLARVASCMYPGDHWTHNPDLKPVKYDPELSKKLLAEAGYAKGLTVKGYMSNLVWSQALAEAVKAMLAEVGVNWKVDLLEPAAASDRMKNLEYDLAQGGWAWIWDPDLMATGLYHPDGGFNYGRSNNPKAIELIEAGRKEIDLAKRTKIYQELERVVYENYEDAWLWWDVSVIVYRKNVIGWNNDLYLKGREGFWFSHPMWFKEGKP